MLDYVKHVTADKVDSNSERPDSADQTLYPATDMQYSSYALNNAYPCPCVADTAGQKKRYGELPSARVDPTTFVNHLAFDGSFRREPSTSSGLYGSHEQSSRGVVPNRSTITTHARFCSSVYIEGLWRMREHGHTKQPRSWPMPLKYASHTSASSVVSTFGCILSVVFHTQ